MGYAVAIVVVLVILFAVMVRSGARIEQKSKTDIKEVFEHIRQDATKGKHFPYVNHENDGGTTAYMNVCGLSELSTYRRNIVDALAVNEPLFLHRHSQYGSRIDVVTPKGIIIGWIPEGHSEILIHHMDSFFDCYVDKFTYDTLTIRAFFTDSITTSEVGEPATQQ